MPVRNLLLKIDSYPDVTSPEAIEQAASTGVVAWDGSRSAARAMADAIPVMRKARKVQVLTVVNEKPNARSGLGDDAMRHFKAYGVIAVADNVDASGDRIGRMLDEYVEKCGSDLLVIGASGRPRVRVFSLGGATEHMLHDPKAPLFLVH